MEHFAWGDVPGADEALECYADLASRASHHIRRHTASPSLPLAGQDGDLLTPRLADVRIAGLSIRRLSKQSLSLGDNNIGNNNRHSVMRTPSPPANVSVMGNPEPWLVADHEMHEAPLPPSSRRLHPPGADEGAPLSNLEGEDDLFPDSAASNHAPHPPCYTDPPMRLVPPPAGSFPNDAAGRRSLEGLVAEMVAKADQCTVRQSSVTPAIITNVATTTPATAAVTPAMAPNHGDGPAAPAPPTDACPGLPTAGIRPRHMSTVALAHSTGAFKRSDWDMPIEADSDLDVEDEWEAAVMNHPASTTWMLSSGIRKRGTIKYTASADVALRCPNVVLSRPRMRRRKKSSKPPPPPPPPLSSSSQGPPPASTSTWAP